MKNLLALLALAAIIISAPASAMDIPFTDNTKYWPTWQNAGIDQNWKWSYPADDTLDTVGTPNLKGGTVRLSSGRLDQIAFNYTGSLSDRNIVKPGDLFIDANADGNWDYAVKLGFSTGAGNYPIGQINLPAAKPSSFNSALSEYILSGYDNTGFWSGYLIRDEHPVGVKDIASNWDFGSAYFSGWQNVDGELQSTFSFSNSPVPLGKEFIIGWEVNCANDVIYERMENPVHAPAPPALLLISSGLVGLGVPAFSRRRRR